MSLADSGSASVAFNPFEDGYHENPYAQYARLRAQDPVHHTAFGPWLVTRYADAEAIARDPQASVSFENASAAREAGDGAPVNYSYPQILKERGLRERVRVLHALDPPEHTQMRRLISKVFTPGRLEQLRPRIQEIVDAQLDRVVADGGMDVISDLAFPLPVQVISDMLGMPEADRKQLSEWSHALAATLDPILTPEQVDAAVEATVAIVDYMEAAIAERRRHPREDLLSGLINVEIDGESLTDDEVLDNAIFLYSSGHETTVNLIGNAVFALLEHPDQLARLRADPRRVPNGIEEILRYDSPVQFTRRVTTSETQIDGATIEPGAIVLICIGAANRDPDYWGETADDLDVDRPDARKHLSFGLGIHHCLGAALSRTEAQVAVGSLVQRFPGLAIEHEPVRRNGVVLRGLESLRLSF